MSFFRLSIFRLLDGKTRPAPLLFSPFFTASCAKARLAFAVKIHPFPPALRFVQGSRLAQSALTEKCDFRWRELNFIWVQRHAAALCISAEIHPFPPALRSVQGSRIAQSALTEKCDFRWRELNFIWVQRHAACRIVKAHLFKGVRKAASSYVPA